MNDKKKREYGTAVERGEIIERTDGKYRVKSLTRDGIVSPPIAALPIVKGAVLQEEEHIEPEFESYAVGDHVYFFLFGDGQGLILAAID